jgi:hypothetical protein
MLLCIIAMIVTPPTFATSNGNDAAPDLTLHGKQRQMTRHQQQQRPQSASSKKGSASATPTGASAPSLLRRSSMKGGRLAKAQQEWQQLLSGDTSVLYEADPKLSTKSTPLVQHLPDPEPPRVTSLISSYDYKRALSTTASHSRLDSLASNVPSAPLSNGPHSLANVLTSTLTATSISNNSTSTTGGPPTLQRRGSISRAPAAWTITAQSQAIAAATSSEPRVSVVDSTWSSSFTYAVPHMSVEIITPFTDPMAIASTTAPTTVSSSNGTLHASASAPVLPTSETTEPYRQRVLLSSDLRRLHTPAHIAKLKERADSRTAKKQLAELKRLGLVSAPVEQPKVTTAPQLSSQALINAMSTRVPPKPGDLPDLPTTSSSTTTFPSTTNNATTMSRPTSATPRAAAVPVLVVKDASRLTGWTDDESARHSDHTKRMATTTSNASHTVNSSLASSSAPSLSSSASSSSIISRIPGSVPYRVSQSQSTSVLETANGRPAPTIIHANDPPRVLPNGITINSNGDVVLPPESDEKQIITQGALISTMDDPVALQSMVTRKLREREYERQLRENDGVTHPSLTVGPYIGAFTGSAGVSSSFAVPQRKPRPTSAGFDRSQLSKPAKMKRPQSSLGTRSSDSSSIANSLNASASVASLPFPFSNSTLSSTILSSSSSTPSLPTKATRIRPQTAHPVRGNASRAVAAAALAASQPISTEADRAVAASFKTGNEYTTSTASLRSVTSSITGGPPPSIQTSNPTALQIPGYAQRVTSSTLIKPAAANGQPFRSASLELEVSLAERLAAIDDTSPTAAFDRLQLHMTLFDDIIHNDKPYGALLARVKHAYDTHNFDSDQKRLENALVDENRRLHDRLEGFQRAYETVYSESANLRLRGQMLESALVEKDVLLRQLRHDNPNNNNSTTSGTAQQQHNSEHSTPRNTSGTHPSLNTADAEDLRRRVAAVVLPSFPSSLPVAHGVDHAALLAQAVARVHTNPKVSASVIAAAAKKRGHNRSQSWGGHLALKVDTSGLTGDPLSPRSMAEAALTRSPASSLTAANTNANASAASRAGISFDDLIKRPLSSGGLFSTSSSSSNPTIKSLANGSGNGGDHHSASELLDRIRWLEHHLSSLQSQLDQASIREAAAAATIRRLRSQVPLSQRGLARGISPAPAATLAHNNNNNSTHGLRGGGGSRPSSSSGIFMRSPMSTISVASPSHALISRDIAAPSPPFLFGGMIASPMARPRPLGVPPLRLDLVSQSIDPPSVPHGSGNGNNASATAVDGFLPAGYADEYGFDIFDPLYDPLLGPLTDPGPDRSMIHRRSHSVDSGRRARAAVHTSKDITTSNGGNSVTIPSKRVMRPSSRAGNNTASVNGPPTLPSSSSVIRASPSHSNTTAPSSTISISTPLRFDWNSNGSSNTTNLLPRTPPPAALIATSATSSSTATTAAKKVTSGGYRSVRISADFDNDDFEPPPFDDTIPNDAPHRPHNYVASRPRPLDYHSDTATLDRIGLQHRTT